MAKNKLTRAILWLLALLVAVAVGGLFASGTTLTFPILSWIPEIGHTIVGWVIIIGVIISAGYDLLN